jgi:plastocyanin
VSRRLRFFAATSATVLVLGVPASAGTHGSRVDAALCSFDLTGHAGTTGISPVGLTGGPVTTPVDDVLGQTARNHYTLQGPVSCSGSIDGYSLNGATEVDDGHGKGDPNGGREYDGSGQGTGRGRHRVPRGLGTFSAEGDDPPAPVTDPFAPQGDGTTNACLVINVPFQVTVDLPELHLTGQFTIQSVAFDFALVGTLGDTNLVGRAGLGADPEGSQGECKSTSPYDDWSIVGDFALTDVAIAPDGGAPALGTLPQPSAPPVPPLGQDPHRANVLVPIAQFQYVGGGTANGPDGTDPSTAVNLPGLTVFQGDRITFDNLDTHPHTVTSCSDCRADNEVQLPGLPAVGDSERSKCLGKEECPDGLFDSERALDPVGGVWTLDTSHLAPGDYDFFCEFHRWMRGTFRVVPRMPLP